jgi:phytol kinase
MPRRKALLTINFLFVLVVFAKAFGVSSSATPASQGITSQPIRKFCRDFRGRLCHLHLSKKNNDDLIELKRSPRSLVATVGITVLVSAIVAAKGGILPGPQIGGGTFGDYSDSLILRDLGATLLTGLLGYAFVQANTWAVEKNWVEPRDSRKLIHTLSAPLFIVCWPIFSNASGARVFAAIVPALNACRLYLASRGTEETSLARAVSRSGDSSEALGGPFIYVIILATVILTFWRNSPIGIVALSALAAGDGMADLVGRRYGKGNKWPGFNKSIAGSMAFWFASTACSTGLLLWLQYCGCFALAIEGFDLVVRLALICFAAAALELLPVLDDNYTVPLSAALFTYLWLH